MHEHIAQAMYYCSIHLLYASLVAGAAWALTSIPGPTATTKYWIWVLTAFNFVVPSGALIDKLWRLHLAWASPLGAIGGPIWDMTASPTVTAGLAVIWIVGSFSMFVRLLSRLQRERRSAQAPAHLNDRTVSSAFITDGIPVSFGYEHPSPAVRGVLSPHIFFPAGIDRLLNPREFHAVLIHELAHARRRDNLIRLFYELSLCAFWFHPLIWLAGARMALYRELSCDESVIRHAHGQALVSALAKLAVPGQAGFLEATASSHVGPRLARLAGPPQPPRRTAGLLLASLFGAAIVVGVFETVAHTACCFIKH